MGGLANRLASQPAAWPAPASELAGRLECPGRLAGGPGLLAGLLAGHTTGPASWTSGRLADLLACQLAGELSDTTSPGQDPPRIWCVDMDAGPCPKARLGSGSQPRIVRRAAARSTYQLTIITRKQTSNIAMTNILKKTTICKKSRSSGSRRYQK